MTGIVAAESRFVVTGSASRSRAVHLNGAVQMVAALAERCIGAVKQLVVDSDNSEIAAAVILGAMATGTLVVGAVKTGRVTDAGVVNRSCVG